MCHKCPTKIIRTRRTNANAQTPNKRPPNILCEKPTTVCLKFLGGSFLWQGCSYNDSGMVWLHPFFLFQLWQIVVIMMVRYFCASKLKWLLFFIWYKRFGFSPHNCIVLTVVTLCLLLLLYLSRCSNKKQKNFTPLLPPLKWKSIGIYTFFQPQMALQR